MSSKRSSNEAQISFSESCSKRVQLEREKKPVEERFLSALNIFILPAGIQKARLSILKYQVLYYGGKVQDTFDSTLNYSHVIVEDNIDIPRMKRILKLDSVSDLRVVKTSWLSLCLRNKKMENFEDFQLKEEEKSNLNSLHTEVKTTSCHTKQARPVPDATEVSDYESSDEDGQLAGKNLHGLSHLKPPQTEKWICAQSSKSPRPNMNKHITDKLEEMVKTYESTNDRWRALGYQKAIQTLRKHPKEISSWEEAKSLPSIGARLADKIWEIAQSGELRKLKEFESSKELQILKMFTNVWGAGPHTAQLWYQQGFRTIADLEEKANLNHQQKVGVRLYDDFLDRMPREEAAEIEQVVKRAAEAIQPGIIAQTCGSYRRGQPTCGDVDVLITHPDGKSHKHVFHRLLADLKQSGFLTDDLVSAEETGNQRKYMGVCKLPGQNRKHRRIDVIVVPYSEYACALVYFTGSAHFNRSLRHLCKKQNMSLNEHALKQGVVRKGAEKIYEGTVVPTPTEESVFKMLKIPFRPPEERDH
ncbi:hypothetical protein EGW08_019209 [Elysia chlorotica]|uniref:DNA polymerase n=1 Tax=Elysia chlorotica TaxID=188477 RepID=A0A433SUQ6_ELYCH|nr:hypothetical protein EGW08_019209 [Elysia chlorotica]